MRTRSIRIGADLSLAEVAEPVGVDRSTIFKWERGTRVPRGEAAIRYGRLLDRLAGWYGVIEVELPPDPPTLTPGAARALLAILLAATRNDETPDDAA